MHNDQIAGRLIAFAAAIFYGFNTTLSRLAYDTGTTPVSLTVYRFLMTSAALVLLVLILRKSWRIQVSPWLFLICVIGLYVTSIGHLGAVNYISVSLSAIIFYTFPLQVIAWKRLVNRQAVNLLELLGFILAFVGLVIALGPEFHETDIRGLLLALSGSFGATLFIVSYERFPKNTDSYVGSMWLNIATLVLCVISLQFGFDLVPPTEQIGWVYLIAIMAFSVTSFTLSLQAIKKIGGSIFALILNFEPVVILILAWVVIGEDLSLTRISGIALVVTALFVSHWRPKKLAE